MAPGNNFKDNIMASVSAPWDSKKVAVVDKLSLSEAFCVKKNLKDVVIVGRCLVSSYSSSNHIRYLFWKILSNF
jgi:hypothetical protein